MNIVRREIRTDGLEIRESEGKKSRTIVGQAIMFNTPSVSLYEDESLEIREVISPDAITKELLDASDIKMTMFHNREKILSRSNKGKGTLSYRVSEDGVSFEFDSPKTSLGDEALELVRRGDICGCSFAFSTDYADEDCVNREVDLQGDKKVVTYTVRHITGVYDFTLAADPAYTDTSVSAREVVDHERELEKAEQQRQEEETIEREAHDALVKERVAKLREEISKLKSE